MIVLPFTVYPDQRAKGKRQDGDAARLAAPSIGSGPPFEVPGPDAGMVAGGKRSRTGAKNGFGNRISSVWQ